MLGFFLVRFTSCAVWSLRLARALKPQGTWDLRKRNECVCVCVHFELVQFGLAFVLLETRVGRDRC